MLVSNLQQFLRLLVPPLAAAGINQSSQKNVTGSLESVAAALEPFRDQSMDQLAEFLRLAEEYRLTGKIPVQPQPKKAPTRTPRAAKTPKITTADAVALLRDVQQRSDTLDPTQIAQEVQRLSPLTVKGLQEVQREFLGLTIGKKKDEILAALQKRIDDFRASRERVAGILAS